MEFFKWLFEKVSTRRWTLTIVNVLCLSLIFLIGYHTFPFWDGILDLVIKLIKPFFIGFLIAYVFNPFIVFLEKYGIKRGIGITIVLTITLAILTIFIGTLVPMLYDKAFELINTFSSGLDAIQRWLLQSFELDVSDIIHQIRDYIYTFPDRMDILNNTLSLVSAVINVVSTYTIYLVLAIYFMSGFDKIKAGIAKIASHIHKNTYLYLHKIDRELSSYVKATILIMLIKSIIYCAMYFIVGHPNWLILGLLTGFSSFIPYVGPIISNIIGIITALGLGTWNIVALLIFITILSNTDNYILAPKVYSSKIQIEPLWVLFAIMAGSTLYGIVGIVVAMPILLIIKICLKTYFDRLTHVENK